MKTPRGKRRPFVPAREQIPEVQLERIVGEAIVEKPDGKRVAKEVMLRKPIAERASWDDPDDQNTRSKAPRQVYGYRRPNVLRAMHLRSGNVTKKHLDAAEKLIDLQEIAAGARPGEERAEVRSSNMPTAISERQLAAIDMFNSAMDAVGRAGNNGRRIVEAIVLNGVDLSTWALHHACSRDFAAGQLVAAMDRLVEFFEPMVIRGEDEPNRQISGTG